MSLFRGPNLAVSVAASTRALAAALIVQADGEDGSGERLSLVLDTGVEVVLPASSRPDTSSSGTSSDGAQATADRIDRSTVIWK
ncbi:hypothetical protein BH160DRAFT_5748 [Burkholderia sp. H160]|nr:hypothetical protein BH160DRAFT_5748 [Burkholderia sp. H160]